MQQWVLALALLATSCGWSELPAPTSDVATPPTCGNGVCETQTENCANCKIDCSCCVAIASNGSNVKDEQNAVGSDDQAFAQLGENSALTLVFGRGIYNDPLGTAPDFKLIGTVTSNPSAQAGVCSASSSGTGAFEVQVSDDGVKYSLVGFWTSKTDEQSFDISCSQLQSARFVQLQGQPGATATLDALVGITCLSQ